MKHGRKVWKKALDMELREHRSSFIVYMVLRALVIAAMIRQFLHGNYERFACKFRGRGSVLNLWVFVYKDQRKREVGKTIDSDVKNRRSRLSEKSEGRKRIKIKTEQSRQSAVTVFYTSGNPANPTASSSSVGI